MFKLLGGLHPCCHGHFVNEFTVKGMRSLRKEATQQGIKTQDACKTTDYELLGIGCRLS